MLGCFRLSVGLKLAQKICKIKMDEHSEIAF